MSCDFAAAIVSKTIVSDSDVCIILFSKIICDTVLNDFLFAQGILKCDEHKKCDTNVKKN